LRRIDRRTLAGVTLSLVAALLVLLITRPPEEFLILTAGSDLPAGVALADLDIDVRTVESTDGLIEGDDVGELADWTLAHPVAAGEPLLPSLLRAPETAAAPNLFSISLEESHAVLGRISAGDHIDIYVTLDARAGEPDTTELLAPDVYVVETRNGSRLGSVDRIDLLLAVDDGLAAKLATAVRAGHLDLVKRGP
jgi:Flp pilus assembly protein CpaB